MWIPRTGTTGSGEESRRLMRLGPWWLPTLDTRCSSLLWPPMVYLGLRDAMLTIRWAHQLRRLPISMAGWTETGV